MGRKGGLRRLLRIPLPARQQASTDLRAEFELHLELRAAELEAEGLSPEEARAEALRLFGDPERAHRELLRSTTRHVREQRGREAVWNMVRDIRYAWRSLVRSPAFTAVAVATLALGIGATTAIFSVVDAVLIDPLPIRAPERVAMIWEAPEREGADGRNVVNPANYTAWRARSETFLSMAGVFGGYATVLTDGAGARQVGMQYADPGLFAVLGVAPLLGRAFVAEEGAAAPGAADVAVLSHGFWRDHFGGDPGAVGATLELVGARVEVIGVMGPELDFFAPDVAFWLPTDFSWGNRTDMGRFIRVVGRLAPGASMAAADSELRSIAAALEEEYPDFNTNWSANVVPLNEQVKGEVRPALLVLLGAVGLLLLVMCVNMANLLLVRGAARRTEVAVRASLGAGRSRIIRELLTESLLLAVAGGAAGVGLAYAVTRLLATRVPDALRVPRLEEAAVDPGVLGFGIVLALATGLLFGLAPALEAFRTDLVGALREGSRGGGGGHRSRRLRSAVVVGEVAVSLVLLVGAGLLLRSFLALQATELGLRPESVVTGRITMQGERYGTGEARASFVDQTVAAVDGVAGVQAAGAISWLPLAGGISATGYYLPGQPRPASGEMLITEVQTVEGQVFEALGIPLLAGRRFTAADGEGSGVVIVNEAFAAQTWPGEDPIGRRFLLPWDGEELLTVIGVVADVRQRGVEQAARPALYRPHADFQAFPFMSLVAWTGAGDAAAVGRQMVARVQALDPTMAVADLRTMDAVVADAIARPRLISGLVAAFAALALLLAALGIYGVLAYAVSLRRHELGVRQALGARAADVARLVFREALTLAGAGVLIGGVAAALAAGVLSGQLYQVSPRDPAVFAATAAALLLVALGAAAVPALRAARVAPVRAVRQD